jgi:hypothetical protein
MLANHFLSRFIGAFSVVRSITCLLFAHVRPSDRPLLREEQARCDAALDVLRKKNKREDENPPFCRPRGVCAIRARYASLHVASPVTSRSFPQSD